MLKLNGYLCSFSHWWPTSRSHAHTSHQGGSPAQSGAFTLSCMGAVEGLDCNASLKGTSAYLKLHLKQPSGQQSSQLVTRAEKKGLEMPQMIGMSKSCKPGWTRCFSHQYFSSILTRFKLDEVPAGGFKHYHS